LVSTISFANPSRHFGRKFQTSKALRNYIEEHGMASNPTYPELFKVKKINRDNQNTKE
jgi:hypothetical protein